MCHSNICDEVEPSKNLTIRLSDLEDEVDKLNDELDDAEADAKATADEAVAALLRARKERDRMAATFRDNFSRMEALMTKKDELIATLGSELDEFRKGRRQRVVAQCSRPLSPANMERSLQTAPSLRHQSPLGRSPPIHVD